MLLRVWLSRNTEYFEWATLRSHQGISALYLAQLPASPAEEHHAYQGERGVSDHDG